MLDVQANASQSGEKSNLIFPPKRLRNHALEELLRARVEQCGLPAYISGRHFASHHEDKHGEPFICMITDQESVERQIAFAAAWIKRSGKYEVGRLLH